MKNNRLSFKFVNSNLVLNIFIESQSLFSTKLINKISFASSDTLKKRRKKKLLFKTKIKILILVTDNLRS